MTNDKKLVTVDECIAGTAPFDEEIYIQTEYGIQLRDDLLEKVYTDAQHRWEHGGKEMYDKLQANTDITVTLTPKLRLEQALQDAGIENPAEIRKLTINGKFTKGDSRFIWENMRTTLDELDMANALVEKKYPFSFTFPDSECNLTTISFFTIPKSVTKVDAHLPFLLSFVVHPDNPALSTEDGVLFNKDKTKLILYPQGRVENYVIPDSVTEIGEIAFHGCEGLTSIIIPDSVTEIGNYAFSYCSGLTSVTIPNSVTKIKKKTFSDCENLTSIDISNSVTEIETSAFEGCLSLTSITIPDSVVKIGKCAFKSYAEDYNPFFTVHPDNPVYKSKNGKLMHKPKKSVTLQAEINF